MAELPESPTITLPVAVAASANGLENFATSPKPSVVPAPPVPARVVTLPPALTARMR